MNESLLVSVITVVYNGEKYLEQTIDSVFNQTYKNIEYLIIDGGSTDNTIAIIKHNKDKITKWISEPDNGLYDAMNKGISMASGKLIGIINSDDWYELDAVEIMAKAYLANPLKTIFHADRYDVYSDKIKKIRKFNPSVFKFKYYGMTYNHPSMFIAKKEYEKHKYSTSLRALSDFQFVLEAFINDAKTFIYIEEPIVYYRLDGISAQMKIKDRLKEGYISRRDAGLPFFENLLALSIRSIFFIYKSIF